MNAQTLGLTLLAADSVPNFLAGMMPSLFTIRTFAGQRDPDKMAALRRGELVGSAMALTAGLGASLVADSPAPFLACAGYLAWILYEYERAIATPISKPLDMAAA